ncbi:universal stress protein [Erythrobacter alti]|uniref:universal stress protein n=1 Tax=Erythrobacter alti TaxID=1896145 RepID=UPI0030F39D1B
MKSILLHAHDEPRFDARLQAALDLARAFDGHLTLFHATPMTMVVPTDPWGVTMVDVSDKAKVRAEEFYSRVTDKLEGEDVRWDWISDVGVAGSQMLNYAALSDIAIIGADDPGESKGASQLAGILALQCRTPILVTPDGASGFDPEAPALVGWNGSLEASRAVRAATPLLARASSVTLVQVSEKRSRNAEILPALSGARYLDRHGISSEILEVERDGGKVSAALKNAAKARGAGLIVMGAYGVPRLLETVFGGVTREMLQAPEVPVLLTH